MAQVIRYFGLAVWVYYFGDKTEKLIKQVQMAAGLPGCLTVINWFGCLFFFSKK